MASNLGITVKKEEDFSEWYTQVILKSEMMDYSQVSGCMVMRPNSQEVWDAIRNYMDEEFKKRGVRNSSFPLFIPESLLEKETEHVEGFTPEVAWVTQTGDSELNERLAVRPTSETIMYDSYSKWVRSHNDLPLKLNQWGNVVRWEFKHPVPFLRTREFFWQEGHTVFASKKEADAEVEDILKLYSQVYEDLLAIPMIMGRKSDKEKFAGADYTLSIEGYLPNGKAIQAASGHMLGQNFSKPFDIKFQHEDGETRYAWQNSWGFTTRSIGIMVMVHGDDKGVVMPPRVAPLQAVIVPILFSDKPELNKKILQQCRKLEEKLDVRVKIDDRENYTPGWKFNHWELRGVPLRIEIGPKDIDKGHVVVVRRDTGDKDFVKNEDLAESIPKLLEEMHNDLLSKAQKMLEDNTTTADSLEALKKAIQEGKLALADWCGQAECEEEVKDKTGGAKTLNTPMESTPKGKCFNCEKKATVKIYFGKSY